MSIIQQIIDKAQKNYEEIKKENEWKIGRTKSEYKKERLQEAIDKAKKEYIKEKNKTIEKRLAEQLHNAKGDIGGTITAKFAYMPLVKEIFHIMKPELDSWPKLKKFEPFTMLHPDYIDDDFVKEFDDMEMKLRGKVTKRGILSRSALREMAPPAVDNEFEKFKKKKMSATAYLDYLSKQVDSSVSKEDFKNVREPLKYLKEGYDGGKYGAVIMNKILALAEKFNARYKELFP